MKVLLRIAKEMKRYKWHYIVALTATLLVTVINLIAPKIMSQMTGVVVGGMDDADLNRILIMSIELIGLYLFRVVCRFFSSYFAHKGAWNLVKEIRIKMYDHMQCLSMSFYHDRQTGDLMSRVVNDTATFEMLFAHIVPESLTNAVTVVGVLGILLSINYKLALLTFIPVPFILAACIYFVKKVRPNFRKAQGAVGEINAKLQDNFSGMQEVQAFGREEYESERVGEKAQKHATMILHALKRSAVFHPTIDFLSAVGTVLVVGIGGLLAYKGELGIEEIVAFMLYLSLFYNPIASIARLMEDAQTAYAGAERVTAIMDKEPQIKDCPNAEELSNVEGEVKFEDVKFSYDGKTNVLDGITFECKPRQTVALVGATGVGKTTIANLIGRFYEPTSGRITVDGKDISKVTLASLRRAVSPVLQETFLFNATIEENIKYARPEATLDEVRSAARLAKIDEDILAMPNGYDTIVGERGVRLSGGQKQRVAIARAFLRESPIVILDEATASVDNATERNIQEAIGELSKKRTVVAIAHRLSTIKSADLIIVLENGRIKERGTHSELLSQEGLYKKLVDAENVK